MNTNLCKCQKCPNYEHYPANRLSCKNCKCKIIDHEFNTNIENILSQQIRINNSTIQKLSEENKQYEELIKNKNVNTRTNNKANNNVNNNMNNDMCNDFVPFPVNKKKCKNCKKSIEDHNQQDQNVKKAKEQIQGELICKTLIEPKKIPYGDCGKKYITRGKKGDDCIICGKKYNTHFQFLH